MKIILDSMPNTVNDMIDVNIDSLSYILFDIGYSNIFNYIDTK